MDTQTHTHTLLCLKGPGFMDPWILHSTDLRRRPRGSDPGPVRVFGQFFRQVWNQGGLISLEDEQLLFLAV